jgi:superfamily I DNA/RNA helicase
MKVDAIFGPPGTGKTTELLNLARGKPALFLSFTKAAALEVRSRLGDDGDLIHASTIHSMAFNTLSINKAQVVDKKKMAEFAKETGIPFKGSEEGSDELQEGDEYSSVLSFSNNRVIEPNEAYDHFGCPGTRHKFEMFVSAYKKWKSTFGYIDFDDMLHMYLNVECGLKFQRVFLDEAQDCSPLQWKVFKHMIANAGAVTIAGDDDQAIYEWNGASPHGMVDFISEKNGKTRVLAQSHRIPHSVHDFVHDRILPQISRRVDKPFAPRSDIGQLARYGDFHDINHRALAKSQTLILVRDRWKMEEVKKTLNREMIPYDVSGGHSPWTSALARQIRAGP